MGYSYSFNPHYPEDGEHEEGGVYPTYAQALNALVKLTMHYHRAGTWEFNGSGDSLQIIGAGSLAGDPVIGSIIIRDNRRERLLREKQYLEGEIEDCQKRLKETVAELNALSGDK